MYTLKDKDRLVISNFLYTPAVGDIVVLNLPDNFNVPIIKRIIATEGQMLNITKGGDVYVDGSRIGEVGSIVIKDRKLMSKDGILITILNI